MLTDMFYTNKIRPMMNDIAKDRVYKKALELIDRHKYAKAWDVLVGDDYISCSDCWGPLRYEDDVAALIIFCADEMSPDEYKARYNVSAKTKEEKDLIIRKVQSNLEYLNYDYIAAWDQLTFGSMENFEILWGSYRYDEALELLKQAENGLTDKQKNERGITVNNSEQPKPERQPKPQPKEQPKPKADTQPAQKAEAAPQHKTQPEQKPNSQSVTDEYGNDTKLHRLLLKADEDNDADAMYEAAIYLSKMPDKNKQQLASSLMMSAALAGHPKANADGAASFYKEGMYEESMEFAVRGAKNGSFECMELGIGIYLDEKNKKVPFNQQQLISFLDAAAQHPDARKKENADFAWIFAELYRKGEKIPKDISKAIFWYSIAYENGNESAGLIVAMHYFEGEGVARDTAKAVKIFNEAAKSKNEKIRATAHEYINMLNLQI